MNIKELSDEKLLQLYSKSLEEIKRRDGLHSHTGEPLDEDGANYILYQQMWKGCEECEWEVGNKDCQICKGKGEIDWADDHDSFTDYRDAIEYDGGQFLGFEYGRIEKVHIDIIHQCLKMVGGDLFTDPMLGGGDGGEEFIIYIPQMLRKHFANPPKPSCDCDPKVLLNQGCNCGNE